MQTRERHYFDVFLLFYFCVVVLGIVLLLPAAWAVTAMAYQLYYPDTLSRLPDSTALVTALLVLTSIVLFFTFLLVKYIVHVAAAALFLRIPFGREARTSVAASAESSSLLPGPLAAEAVSEPSGFKTIGQCLAVATGSSFYVCHGHKHLHLDLITLTWMSSSLVCFCVVLSVFACSTFSD